MFKAFAIVALALALVLGVTMWLSYFESGQGRNMETLIFEATSAFATVGLSEGITPSIETGSKIGLIFGMYLGRVGPITVLLALSRRRPPTQISYPEAKILIG